MNGLEERRCVTLGRTVGLTNGSFVEKDHVHDPHRWKWLNDHGPPTVYRCPGVLGAVTPEEEQAAINSIKEAQGGSDVPSAG